MATFLHYGTKSINTSEIHGFEVTRMTDIREGDAPYTYTDVHTPKQGVAVYQLVMLAQGGPRLEVLCDSLSEPDAIALHREVTSRVARGISFVVDDIAGNYGQPRGLAPFDPDVAMAVIEISPAISAEGEYPKPTFKPSAVYERYLADWLSRSEIVLSSEIPGVRFDREYNWPSFSAGENSISITAYMRVPDGSSALESLKTYSLICEQEGEDADDGTPYQHRINRAEAEANRGLALIVERALIGEGLPCRVRAVLESLPNTSDPKRQEAAA